MASRTIYTIEDASGERSSFRVAGVTISSANYDAQQVLVQALSDALEDMILGALRKREFVSSVTIPNSGVVDNNFAQRENKWLVTYTDTTTAKKQQAEIACPDLDLLVAGSDLMDIGGTEGVAFVTAFEAVVKSENGNAVTVDSIRYVGRNL